MDILRADAVTHYRARRDLGAPLRFEPTWVSAAYWVVVFACLLGAAGLLLGRASGYASGAAVVRIGSAREVVAESDGTVIDVFVTAGQTVRDGDALVALDDREERAELDQVEKALDVALVHSLRQGGSPSAGYGERRSQRDLARARLARRTLRAPHDGIVTDVFVQRGQLLSRGAVTVALATTGGAARVVALLPAANAPEITVGTPLRIELAGHSFAYQTVPISRVGAEALGPTEARRVLGRTAETATITGPVVAVEADLPRLDFEVDGRHLPYRDGMPARADAPVRREPLVLIVAPWLRSLFRASP